MIPSLAITTWPPDAPYAKPFLRSWDRYWKPWGIPLSVRSEQSILQDPNVVAFREREQARKDYKDRDIHKDVLTWSWKVFALTMPPMIEKGWMLWVDGDVEFTRKPTAEFFDTVCPADADVTYLGRPWAYASETGFVGYNMGSETTRALLQNMRFLYIYDGFTRLDERGDAAIFDVCRKDLPVRAVNLAAHCTGPDLHVWPQTILGDYMEHHKGPKRKQEAYA